MSHAEIVRHFGTKAARVAPETFHGDHLVERLSGVGVFQEPPPWATAPRW